MYGCNCHIGCLSGSITQIGGDKHELSGTITRIGKSLSGEMLSITNRLSGYISIICSVNKNAYLNTSTDIVWLTPDMLSEEFHIYSNVSWKID